MRILFVVLFILPSYIQAQNIIFGRDAAPLNGEMVIDTFMFFSKSKAAFRAPALVGSDFWSPDSIGIFSIALGPNTKAKGYGSIAIGLEAESNAASAFAIGSEAKANAINSVALGPNAIAREDAGISIGQFALTTEKNATAIGRSSKAFGQNATAIGHITRATGRSSTSLGYDNDSEGNFSMSMGYGSYASSYGEIAIGNFNTIVDPFSAVNWFENDRLLVVGNGQSGGFGSDIRSDAMVVMKNGDVRFPDGGLLVGRDSLPNNGEFVTGKMMFFNKDKGAFRGGTLFSSLRWEQDSIGEASFAYGVESMASKEGAIALGSYNRVQGNYSLAVGNSSVVSGSRAMAFGTGLVASGELSMALGIYGSTKGVRSISCGNGTDAYSYYETALGSYNTEYDPNDSSSWNGNDRLLVVGNGTNLDNRSDAMIILKNGETTFNADLKIYTDGENNDLRFISPTVTDGRVLTRQFNTNNVFVGDIDANGGAVIVRTDGIDRIVYGISGNIAVKNGHFYSETNTNDLGRTGNRWNTVWVGNGVNNASDVRLKKNIQPMTHGLRNLMKLNPVSYQWKNNEAGTKLGLIAQEVHEIISEVVHVPENPEDFLSIDYAELIPVLIKSIQEQQEIIDKQNTKIKDLENLQKEVEELKTMMLSLRKELNDN